MENESGEGISIVVRLLGARESELFVSRSMRVAELKNILAQTFGHPAEWQRLVLEGRLLRDEDRLQDTRVVDGSRLHLCIRRPATLPMEHGLNEGVSQSDFPEMSVPPIEERAAPEPAAEFSPAPEFSFSALSSLVNTIGDTSLNRGFWRKLARTQQRMFGFQSLDVESLEILRQNLKTISQLLLSDRNWEVGQWVDACDTVEQWLEAEVIATKDRKVLIHYNGFSEKWDEWMDRDSERLAVFRSHTVPSPYQTYLGPVPDTVLDGGVRSRPPKFSAIDAVRAVERLLNQLIEMLRSMIAPRSEGAKEETAEGQEDLLTRVNAKITTAKPESAFAVMQPSEVDICDRELQDKKEKKADNLSLKLEDQYNVERKSLNSLRLEKVARPVESPSRSISSKGIRSQDSFGNYSHDEQQSAEKKFCEASLKAKAKKLAPLLDRLGRAMIDLAPHLAMMSAPLVRLSSAVLGDVSTQTVDGSVNLSSENLRLFDRFSDAPGRSRNLSQHCAKSVDSNTLSSTHPLFFQVPVLLKPGEVLQAQLQSQEASGGFIDLHINATVQDSAKASEFPRSETP